MAQCKQTKRIACMSKIHPVRTQFVTTPIGLLGSYIKDPNNKICRAWAERLGLDHRTEVSHGV